MDLGLNGERMLKFEKVLPRARYGGRLVLASSSPRRQALMREAGYAFEVMVPKVPEDRLRIREVRALTESLAYAKARQVADALVEGVVIGADTVVAHEGEVIGKPGNDDEARMILKRLSGTTHEVITGVCVVNARRGERLLGSDVTRIAMREFSEEDVAEYVRTGEALGKAGAYAIQENGDRFVERIEGSFTNVVGLPMELLAVLIDAMGELIYKD